MAYVVLRPGATTTQAELLVFCETAVSERAAIPKRIEIVASMPMTAVGKIFRPLLREQISAAVLQEHLKQQGIDAEVNCKADSKLGMTAQIKLAETSNSSKASELLSAYNIVVSYRV
jgi:fatty-acyl-CoA synthase